MNVENRLRIRVDHWPAENPHETGEADEPDITRLELTHQRAIVFVARRPASMTDDDRLDAGGTCTLETQCIRLVRDDHRNRGIQTATGDGVDQRLQIRAATGNQHA